MNDAAQSEADTSALWSGFQRSAQAFPDRPALEVNGQPLKYEQLRDAAASLAATLSKHSLSEPPPLTAIFEYGSSIISIHWMN
jgi:non-ribosomal peptide synthetase component E (peptide arylation enzyme)